MTLRRFLDVAQAILVQELVRGGLDLMSALEEIRQFAAGNRKNGAKPERTAAQNDAALAQLQQAMGGIALG